VDFDVLIQRNRTYREAEKRSLEEYQQRVANEERPACMVEEGAR